MSRYIDADILAEMVEEEFDDLVVYDVPPDEAVDDICDIIDSCPTVDVAPVVHGHWIAITADVHRCSNCDQLVRTKDIVPYRFCNVCGAKMDSEDTDNE